MPCSNHIRQYATGRLLVLTLLAPWILSACGGGGSSRDPEQTPATPPAAPTTPTPNNASLSISDASIREGDSGVVIMSFTVSLDSAASADVTFNYETRDGSAVAPTDYASLNGARTIASGDLEARIEVEIQGDTDQEATETFQVVVSNVVGADVGNNEAQGSILDNDQPAAVATGMGLNDTGVTFCSDGAMVVDCGTAAAIAGQDGQDGRDVTNADDTDGVGGFAFTKLAADGTATNDQAADYASSPWACVRDEVTGLIWEVKTDDNGLHDAESTYSYFDSSGQVQLQGFENLGQCNNPGACDSEKYRMAVNTAGLCGYNDWRVPTRSEMLSLLNFGVDSGETAIDLAYFPNANGRYWTSSEAQVSVANFSVDVERSSSAAETTTTALAIRLVRGVRER